MTAKEGKDSGGGASWTGLLESLHSALIDEVTERHPEPKPELGLPTRHVRWETPNPAISALVICDVTFGAGRGMALLAAEPGCELKLKQTLPQLWEAVLKRAGAEFSRRGIRPRLGTAASLAPPFSLPAAFSEPGRLIWIPLRIGGAGCYLGVGVT